MSALINFNGQTLFKVPVAGSLTVPSVATQTSPTGVANNNTIRNVVGGQLLCTYDDVASAVVQLCNTLGTVDQTLIRPGDVIACSAVGVPAANNVTVTITSVDGTVRTFIMAGVAAVAGVIGFYA